MPYAYLATAILAEIIATTALKSADGFTRAGPTALSVAGYLVAFYCLSVTLRDIPTGVAYAIWSGVGTVMIALIAWILHDQKLDAGAMVGIALIITGVIVMNLFSHTVS